ncbi:MAG: hypothetical protein IPL97_06285 [Niastella sp.]|nr:hypothetical protein [Niastella sp.]
MKKFIAALVLVCYCSASFGVSINYFYCCGKLRSVTLTEVSAEKSCTPMPRKGCCENKKLTLKITVDQANQSLKYIKADISSFSLPAYLWQLQQIFYATQNLSPLLLGESNPPPLLKRNILFCVFRI